jgi:hypothetical protein
MVSWVPQNGFIGHRGGRAIHVGFAERRHRIRLFDQVWAAMDGGVGGVVRDAISKAGSVPVKKIWERSMPVETCG